MDDRQHAPPLRPLLRQRHAREVVRFADLGARGRDRGDGRAGPCAHRRRGVRARRPRSRPRAGRRGAAVADQRRARLVHAGHRRPRGVAAVPGPRPHRRRPRGARARRRRAGRRRPGRGERAAGVRRRVPVRVARDARRDPAAVRRRHRRGPRARPAGRPGLRPGAARGAGGTRRMDPGRVRRGRARRFRRARGAVRRDRRPAGGAPGLRGASCPPDTRRADRRSGPPCRARDRPRRRGGRRRPGPADSCAGPGSAGRRGRPGRRGAPWTGRTA